MKTIFALFESYEEAKAAVAELIDRRFDEGEMNVIVREPVTQAVPESNLRAMNRTGLREGTILEGIDRVLTDGKSVSMPDVGAVCAAGKIAAMTAGAMMPGRPAQSLGTVLAGFGVPEELAEFYRSGVLEGGILFWVRADESRAAEAADILSSTRAEKLVNYA